MTTYQYAPMLWPTLGSAAFIGGVAVYLWRRRNDTKGALALAAVGFVLSLWCLGAAAEVAATDVATQRLWFLVRDALTLPGAIFAFWFAIQYAGLERWLTRPVVAILAGVFLVHISLYFVDGARLLWSNSWWNGGVQGDRGPLGVAFGAFDVVLFLLATAVFLFLFTRSPAHRVPVALILVGQVALRVIYPLGVFNVVDVPNIPAAVLSFDFVTVMYVIALFRFRLFDLVPVARETITERMPDAILVLDQRDRIADLNAAAATLLRLSRKAALGRPIADSLAAFPVLVERLAGVADGLGEVQLGDDGLAPTCQLVVTPLADWQGLPIGRLVVLHDISELRRAEARFVRQERDLATAGERERMARELHDRLGQVVGFVGLQADAARKLLGTGRTAEADAQLRRLATVAREAHADLRAYIAELRAAPGERRPFLATVRHFLDVFGEQAGVGTELSVGPSFDAEALGPEAEEHLLRIVQEALANAAAHARARTLRVVLEAEDRAWRIAVEDDGRGFDPRAETLDGHYGLRFMRERAAELGGRLDVVSSPGEGTHVLVRFPLDGLGSAASPTEAAGERAS